MVTTQSKGEAEGVDWNKSEQARGQRKLSGKSVCLSGGVINVGRLVVLIKTILGMK